MSEEAIEELNLELGSIIRINAPGNSDLNGLVFFIKYIDDALIKLVEENTLEEKTLNIDDGGFSDETIDSIEILDIPDEKGYARQNNLLTDNWISIRFGGDIPDIINGKISNLDEDMIELTTYPDKQKLYIDFGYKGIPLHLPIASITEFKTPVDISIKREVLEAKDDEDVEGIELPEGMDEYMDYYEEEEVAEETQDEINTKIDRMILDADQIEFGEDFEEITQFVPVEKYQERFGIDTQANDLLDDLLSGIPNNSRSEREMKKIHLTVERFKQLRKQFSKVMSDGDIDIPNTKGADFKPLKESLLKLDQRNPWFLPIVKIKKKIYDKDEEQYDVYNMSSVEDYSRINEAFKNYKQNTVSDRENKYNYLFREIANSLNPIRTPEVLNDIVIEKEVLDDFEALISNDSDFSSHSIRDDNLLSNSFLIQRYNTGITRLHFNDLKNLFAGRNRVNISPNDKMAINGFIQLPETSLKYSSIFLNKTNILNRCDLHFKRPYLFRILNSSSDIEKKEITNESEDVYFDNSNYLEKMKAFIYKNETYYDDRDVDEDYSDLLSKIIPRTRFLFHLVKEKIENTLSYDKIIEYLERFMIYHDDITFKQYEIITGFINENILELNKLFIEKNRSYKRYYDYDYKGIKTGEVYSYLFELLTSNVENDAVLSNYSLRGESTDEFLKRIYELDYGKLYSLSLCLTQDDLMQPIDIDDVLKKASEMSIDDFPGSGESKEETDCSEFVLAKQYMAIDELRADDGKQDVYFDSKYDTTRYDIGDEYNDEKSAMPVEVFAEFLVQKLEQNVGLSKQKAFQEADAIINGKRKVDEGDYAFLIDDQDEYNYYIRKGGVWSIDETLNGKNISNIMFCNLKESCINIKKSCNKERVEVKQIRDRLVEEILGHFEEDFHMSSADLKTFLEKSYRKGIESMEKRRLILNESKWRIDVEHSKMGDDVIIENRLKSPNQKLLYMILGQSDFIKKQSNIILFVDKFCREHNNSEENESQHWYYCNITNEPLLPTYFYDLAKSYYRGNYKEVLDEICAKRGTLSEDGGEVVDKHSGFVIRKIQLDFSEGFDETGFRIVSREVIEKDMMDIFEEGIKEDRVFPKKTSDEEVYITNMINAFDLNMGINTSEAHSSIISDVLSAIHKKVPSRENFRKMMKMKKGKKKYKYENVLDETLLKYTLGYYLVGLQTLIPSVRAKKTFPNCVRSFSGYPTMGDGDFSSLKYLICVALKLKTTARPWNRLPRSNRSNFNEIVEKYLLQIKKFIDNSILKEEEILHKIKVKEDYLRTVTEEEDIMSDFDVTRWTTFLPPLFNLNIKGMYDVSDDFRDDLLKNMTKGNDRQFDQISALIGKIIYFSFHIQELMDKVVNKNVPLLKDITNTSFLQNACCNDGNKNAHIYFVNKSKDIQKFNEYVESFSQLKRHISKSVRASQLFCPIDTSFPSLKLTNNLDEETVYAAFIHYGKFNSGLELEPNVKAFVGENISEFKSTDKLEKKISILKAEGKQYTESALKKLLSYLQSSDALNINLQPEIITSRKKLERTVEYLKGKGNILICKPELLDMIEQASIDNYEATVEPNDKRVLELLDFLRTNTDELIDEIIDFLDFHGIDEDIRSSLENIDNWHTRGDGLYMQNDDETAVAIATFLKTEIENIMMIYPNMILNGIDFSEAGIPKHWKVHNIHIGDIQNIISAETREFAKFFNDGTIHPILRHMQRASDDLIMLIESTPFLANMEYMGKVMTTLINGKIVKHLMKYYYVCGLNMYIHALEIQVDVDGEMESLENLLDSDIAEKLDESVVKQIITGKREKIQSKIALLLKSFINISEKHKDLLNISNKEIKDNILKAKEREKSKITKRFGDMSVDEREVQNIMKNQRLGRWSLGQTRALYQYDPDQYEKEREELESDMLEDLKLGIFDDNKERNRAIFMMDHLEERAIDERITEDINAMFSNLADDDDYGDYDDEESGYLDAIRRD
jgi:hypothetical protein|uniref:Uncharacterized protein n=1 Tax=viral metagenome TaxID=1070528 RepID=A0A6C0BXY7_9ZZZZ